MVDVSKGLGQRNRCRDADELPKTGQPRLEDILHDFWLSSDVRRNLEIIVYTTLSGDADLRRYFEGIEKDIERSQRLQSESIVRAAALKARNLAQLKLKVMALQSYLDGENDDPGILLLNSIASDIQTIPLVDGRGGASQAAVSAPNGVLAMATDDIGSTPGAGTASTHAPKEHDLPRGRRSKLLNESPSPPID